MAQADLDQRAESLLDRGLPGRWYVVAKSGEVPNGAVRAVKALGRDLVVWRGADGKARCIEDRCPHRGARISLGQVSDSDLACRYHGVTLDGEGRIVRVPAIGNCGLEGRKTNDAYAVTEAADGIFVRRRFDRHPARTHLRPSAGLQIWPRGSRTWLMTHHT